MSFSNGFHKFLDAIGIVSRDEPEVQPREDSRDYDRRDYDRRDRGWGEGGDAGRGFDDDARDYDPPRVTRIGRDTPSDSYRGYSRTDTQYKGDPEVDNMVEFKNIRQPVGSPASGDRMQHTVIHYLRDLADCKDIIDDLLDEKQVVLNIEDTDDEVKQRAIDMIYGASYALGAKMRQVSRATYIIAPSSVVINDTEDDDNRRQSGGYASNVRSFRSQI